MTTNELKQHLQKLNSDPQRQLQELNTKMDRIEFNQGTIPIIEMVLKNQFANSNYVACLHIMDDFKVLSHLPQFKSNENMKEILTVYANVLKLRKKRLRIREFLNITEGLDIDVPDKKVLEAISNPSINSVRSFANQLEFGLLFLSFFVYLFSNGITVYAVSTLLICLNLYNAWNISRNSSYVMIAGVVQFITLTCLLLVGYYPLITFVHLGAFALSNRRYIYQIW